MYLKTALGLWELYPRSLQAGFMQGAKLRVLVSNGFQAEVNHQTPPNTKHPGQAVTTCDKRQSWPLSGTWSFHSEVVLTSKNWAVTHGKWKDNIDKSMSSLRQSNILKYNYVMERPPSSHLHSLCPRTHAVANHMHMHQNKHTYTNVYIYIYTAYIYIYCIYIYILHIYIYIYTAYIYIYIYTAYIYIYCIYITIYI